MHTKLSDLYAFYCKRYRSNRKQSTAKTVRFLKKMINKYGDHTVIHDEPILRDQQAEALSWRLALPKKHVLGQLNNCYRLIKLYREETK